MVSSRASASRKANLCQYFVGAGDKGKLVKLWVGGVIVALSSWVFCTLAVAEGVVFATREANGLLRTSATGEGRLGAPYQSGSIAKYMCTLAAVRLENEGRLSLDDPLSTLLPDFDNPLAEEVTLRLLLQNRSGIADGVVAALRSDPTLPGQSIPAIEAANRFSRGVDGHAPGTVFSYVNANWIVVQAILERATKKPLAALLDDLVFQPAGARGASVFVGELGGPNPVTALGGSLPLPDFISCAGGVASRPEDLIAVARYPYMSSEFGDASREVLATVTTAEQNYTVGGRYEWVRDRHGAKRRISWQSGNNGAWSAQVIYDHVQDVAFAFVAVDADNDLILERRSEWLTRQGLTRLETDQYP